MTPDQRIIHHKPAQQHTYQSTEIPRLGFGLWVVANRQFVSPAPAHSVAECGLVWERVWLCQVHGGCAYGLLQLLCMRFHA